MAIPPKVSDNPRYYSTGKKLDIATGVVPAGWMPKKEYKRMRKQQAAIQVGFTPNEAQLLLLTTALESGDKVAAQIAEWYSLHGVMRLSQLAYLQK